MPTQIGSTQARQVWGLPPSQSIATSLADHYTEAANAGDCMITCSSLEQGFASLHPCVWFGDSLYGGSSFCLPFQQALCGAGIASVVQHGLTQGALQGICSTFWVTAHMSTHQQRSPCAVAPEADC